MSQKELFPNNTNIQLTDADLQYYDNAFSNTECMLLFKSLKEKVSWKSESIKLFGKSIMQPRLTSFYGDNNQPYRYSNLTMTPNQWFSELNQIKEKVEAISQHKFTCVLLNYYRNGNDSMGWHSDDESSLGVNPVIASISFGAERKFMMRHRRLKGHKHNIILGNGSLLIMRGETQHHWHHQIPKTRQPIGPRINLTFRKLI